MSGPTGRLEYHRTEMRSDGRVDLHVQIDVYGKTSQDTKEILNE